MKQLDLLQIYNGSDGGATKALYDKLLQGYGAAGLVAVNLFRAHKNSVRAKQYRGGNKNGSYRSQAYATKQWSIDNLDRVLNDHAAALGIVWGWGQDKSRPGFEWVLYVETPAGQVSFHTPARGKGPDFAGSWDGVKMVGPQRITKWIEAIMERRNAT